MNEWERLSRQAERYRESYPPGTRIVLNHMNDPYAPVEEGTRGTVKYVDDACQIGVNWDNGRTLSIVPDEDSFHKLTPEEIEAEQKTADMDEDDSPVQTM